MFFEAFAYLIFITSLFGSSHQQQNLCGTNPNITFVTDPSTCHTYLRCYDRDMNGFITRFTIGSCYLLYESGANMFTNGGQTCSFSTTHCTNPLLMCPPESEPDIMIADPMDRECRRHRLCRSLNAPYATCPHTLIFNRNTGMCDYPGNAPCVDVLLPPRCPNGFTGFFVSNRCYQYIYCQNGEILLNLECQDGMYFDDIAKSCLYDTNNTCPRTRALDQDNELNPEKSEQ